ncbi:hypothetical protein [Arthrobacter sp. H35-D1]|uniref:hypothetical protein n=1 Tax=Arthrobacter sp. H35-D1 TaxID=3046202 RepID=UPI0024BB27E4|nr:hypothetical protein [Arthrobacter sp. H35-D1]MDJ0315035.1 hypothetical protein [Arthrobacter sp. H35-D1]
MANRNPTPEQAQKMLEETKLFATGRARTDGHRKVAILQLWASLAAFLFLAGFMMLFAATAFGNENLTAASRSSYTVFLLLPVVPFVVLLQGIRNKFPEAPVLRISLWHVASAVPALLGPVAAFAAVSAGYTAPWWLLGLVAAVLVSPMTLGALRVLRSSGHVQQPDAHKTFLPRPAASGRTAPGIVRWMTGAMGLYLGAGTAAAGLSWHAAAGFVLALFAAVAISFTGRQWGLANVSSYWRAGHWVAFAVGAVVMGGSAVAAALGMGSPPTSAGWLPWTIAAGIIGALPLTVGGIVLRDVEVEAT